MFNWIYMSLTKEKVRPISEQLWAYGGDDDIHYWVLCQKPVLTLLWKTITHVGIIHPRGLLHALMDFLIPTSPFPPLKCFCDMYLTSTTPNLLCPQSSGLNKVRFWPILSCYPFTYPPTPHYGVPKWG